MSQRWRWFLPGYVWSLPLAIVGLVLALIYRAHSPKWMNGVLTFIGGTKPDGTTRIWGHPAGQTSGWVQFYASEAHRARSDIRVHENCHVVQAFILGVLWWVVYGGMFVVAYLQDPKAGWHGAYERIWFEIQAYAREAIYVKNPTRDDWGARIG